MSLFLGLGMFLAFFGLLFGSATLICSSSRLFIVPFVAFLIVGVIMAMAVNQDSQALRIHNYMEALGYQVISNDHKQVVFLDNEDYVKCSAKLVGNDAILGSCKVIGQKVQENIEIE